MLTLELREWELEAVDSSLRLCLALYIDNASGPEPERSARYSRTRVDRNAS